jgi:hypothetical protein
MRNNHKTVDAFDEMIRLLVLARGATFTAEDQWIEQMAEQTFGAIPAISPSSEKSAEMLARLREELEQLETFGDLLSSASQQKDIDLSVLMEATKLSRESIEQLSRDELFPNRVPVLLMKRLIEFLGIPFEKAKTALQRTAAFIVDNLKAEEASSLAPAFARRQSSRLVRISMEREAVTGVDAVIDSRVAQTALEIYLQRLEALFATDDLPKGEQSHE